MAEADEEFEVPRFAWTNEDTPPWVEEERPPWAEEEAKKEKKKKRPSFPWLEEEGASR